MSEQATQNSNLTDFETKLRERAQERLPLSADQRREQRINFVYGMVGNRSGISREQVAEIIDRQ